MTREMPVTLNRLTAIKTKALGTGKQIVLHPTTEYHPAVKKREGVLSGLIWGGSQDLLLTEKKRKNTQQLLLQFGEIEAGGCVYRNLSI